jgi:hypothetical protein
VKGSRSAPIGTPPSGRFARRYQQLKADFAGVSVRRRSTVGDPELEKAETKHCSIALY